MDKSKLDLSLEIMGGLQLEFPSHPHLRVSEHSFEEIQDAFSTIVSELEDRDRQIFSLESTLGVIDTYKDSLLKATSIIEDIKELVKYSDYPDGYRNSCRGCIDAQSMNIIKRIIGGRIMAKGTLAIQIKTAIVNAYFNDDNECIAIVKTFIGDSPSGSSSLLNVSKAFNYTDRELELIVATFSNE